MTRRDRATRSLALAPAGIAIGIGLAWILAPSSGPLALFSILSVYLALGCLVLVPVALRWPSSALRWSLAALLVVALLRFSGDWVSLPAASSPADRLTVVTWNVEVGEVSPQAVIEQLATLDADVVAIEELTREQADAIDASSPVTDRFPYRTLEPRLGALGIGLLSRHPIASVESFEDPSGLELTITWAGHETVIIAAHPLPATIRTSTGLRIPTGFDAAARDLRLRTIRTRIDATLRAGTGLVVLGDFNTAPTEPAYQRLVAGLSDAHVDVGQGPGWSWRPGFLGTLPVGLVRIDLILSSPGLRPMTSGVMCPPVGDHCMVRADLVLAR